MSAKDVYRLADALLTESMVELLIWLEDNPDEVERICGASENLSEDDYIRIFNSLSEIHALNIITLFVYRHRKHAQQHFSVCLDDKGFLRHKDTDCKAP